MKGEGQFTDADKFKVLVADLVYEAMDRVRTAEALVQKNQNSPPEGESDGSFDRESWTAARDITDSLMVIARLAKYVGLENEDHPEKVDYKDTFKTALFNRASRLARLTELKAPESVLMNEVMRVIKAAACINPEEMGAALMTWIAGHARAGHGLCSDPKCGNTISGKLTERLCPSCMDSMLKEEDEDDEESGTH